MIFLSLTSSFYGPGPLKVDTFVNDKFGLTEIAYLKLTHLLMTYLAEMKLHTDQL